MIKVILMSISATLLVVAFVTSMFLNSILGVFGLASTSIKTLNNLQESKQIIDKVKTRHKTKKLNVSKKFAKRTTKRIAASAISASTIGTTAVVVAVVGFEIYDYCEDKKEWIEDNNILFSKGEEFDYRKCWNATKNDTGAMIASVKEAVPDKVTSTWKDTKDISNESWETTKRITFDTWGSTKSISSDTWNFTKDVSTDAWNSTSDTTEKLWDSLIDLAY